MKSSAVLLFIFLFYILGFLSHALFLKKTVYGDGVFYYSWLRSVVVDRNVDFTNEYTYFNVKQPTTPIGRIGNKYSIGPALLWAPSYVFIHRIIKGNGYTFPYQLAVGFTSVGLTLIGLLLLYQLLNRFFNERVGIVAITAIAGATNLLFYGSLDAVNSHALSFFTVTLFLYLLLNRNRKGLNFYPVGILLGLIGCIRMQDLVLGLILIPYVRANNVLKILFGFLIALTPQLIAWQLLYGTFWMSPYLSAGESFNFLQPHIFEVLFSSNNGLFVYTPLVFLGFAGLILWKHRLKSIFLRTILLELLVISSWSTWWQGASFSGRMFVSSLPILAFGLANVIQGVEQKKVKVFPFILFASTLNIMLIVFYLLLHR